jgi:hypothetical protein
VLTRSGKPSGTAAKSLSPSRQPSFINNGNHFVTINKYKFNDRLKELGIYRYMWSLQCKDVPADEPRVKTEVYLFIYLHTFMLFPNLEFRDWIGLCNLMHVNYINT